MNHPARAADDAADAHVVDFALPAFRWHVKSTLGGETLDRQFLIRWHGLQAERATREVMVAAIEGQTAELRTALRQSAEHIASELAVRGDACGIADPPRSGH